MLKTWRVVPQGDKVGEEVKEDGGLYGVHPLPDSVGYTIRAGGRGGGAPAKGQLYLFQREWGCVRVGREPPPRRGGGLGGKKCARSASLIAVGESAPGSDRKRGVFLGATYSLAVQMFCWVVLARKLDQYEPLACFIALK